MTKKRICETEGCKRKTDGQRTHCNTCRSRISRAKDPVRYFLNSLRRSATKRDIYFDLELEPFREWATSVGFRFGSGRGPSADSVDRIKNDHTIGYRLGNIQKLTMQQNVHKYNHHDRWIAQDDLPF